MQKKLGYKSYWHSIKRTYNEDRIKRIRKEREKILDLGKP